MNLETLQNMVSSHRLHILPVATASALLEQVLVRASDAQEFLRWLASVDEFRRFPFRLFDVVAQIAERVSDSAEVLANSSDQDRV